MRKLIITGLLCVSCLRTNRIYYSKSINKSIHNLEEMIRWVEDDYVYGDIPENIANNYMIVLVNTKCSLKKKIKEQKKDLDCVD
jgi:hypothetical protein